MSAMLFALSSDDRLYAAPLSRDPASIEVGFGEHAVRRWRDRLGRSLDGIWRGLWRKRWLIAHECRVARQGPTSGME